MNRSDLQISTPDGICTASLFTPPTPSEMGVILFMDAFGPRPALDTMAERIAADGYMVLVPDVLYRSAPYGPFDAKTAFATEESANQIRAMMAATTQAMTIADGRFFLDALNHAGAKKVGVVGYCMGGARALNAASAYPDEVHAAASFHGGNLASDLDGSPHRSAASLKARVYVGVAGVDRSFPPEQSARLARALREAEVDHTIENYVGMAHGWAVPDHSVYDEIGAERHWKRLLTLFEETLQS
jgi:carboxymethylenebutenolidase